MTDRITKRIRVYGIVQGVGFRPTVSRHAMESGITGTVCNKGPYVEIFAQGRPVQVETFLTALRERPPRTAISPWSMSEVELGDAWDTAAALLRRFGYAVTPAAFNARMVEKGWMAKLEFYNHSGRKVKTLMLCDQGVRYGRNVATEGTRSIAYCADLFPKLMHKIGLDDSDNVY